MGLIRIGDIGFGERDIDDFAEGDKSLGQGVHGNRLVETPHIDGTLQTGLFGHDGRR